MDTTFLVLSLFFPRIALLIGYFFAGWIPPNALPFWADMVMGALIPRVLMVIYIAGTLGTDSPWFWVHLIVAILAYISGFYRAANQ